MKARQQPVTQAGSTFTINNHKGEKKKQPFNCSFKVKYNEKQVDKEWTDTYREWFKLCHSTFSGELTIPSGYEQRSLNNGYIILWVIFWKPDKV